MKISLVICIFLAVNCYGRSVKVKRQASCKSVEYDLGMVEFNQFVTNEMKAEVCAKSIVNYNSHSRIPTKYLGGEYNYITHQNPCTVVCRYDPTAHEAIVDVQSFSGEHTAAEPQPIYTLVEYRALPYGTFHVPEKTVCGPQHMCDVNGCCVKEESKPEEPKQPEQPEEHKEPEAPVEEHKEPEAPHEPHQEPETPVEHKEPEVPEHKEPEVPEVHEPEVPEHKEPETPEHKIPETPEEHHEQPETPEEHHEPQAPEEPHHEPETPEHKEPEVPEEHKEPEIPEEHKEPEQPEEHKEPQEPEEPHKEPEEHKEPEPEEPKEPEVPEKEYACKQPGVFADDEDESSFFYCYLKSAHMKCSEGTVFNKMTNACSVLDPHYTEHISCSHEGFYRNPYDCSRFYRCYFNDPIERADGHLRIAFYSCSQNMVFDNTAQTCVLPSATQNCENMLLNVETHLFRQ